MTLTDQAFADAIRRARTGARIKTLRKERGVTAVELADSAGCSKAHISNIESGRSRASDEMLRAIATRLQVTVEDLEVA